MSEKQDVVPLGHAVAIPGSLEEFRKNREHLQNLIKQSLRDGVDFGVIPGTPKPSLFQAGADKFCQFFGLGSRLIDNTPERHRVDLDANFAMFSYTVEVYHLKTDTVLSQMEGSANSQEKKWRARKEDGVLKPTNIGDILNTLQKMAQKRAYVGAVIRAVGASDVLTQDIDTPEDAEQVGVRNEAKRAKVTVTSARSTPTEVPPDCCGKTMMISNYNDGEFYCTKCKKKVPRN